MKEIEATRLKLAAMEMVEGTELKWWSLLKLIDGIKLIDGAYFVWPPELENWRMDELNIALGIIEGKPVWAGDTVWLGEKSGVVQADGGVKMNEGGYAWHLRNRPYSWLPPKPKTAMVELLVEDIEAWASNENYVVARMSLAEACRKTLEQLK